MVLIAVSGWLSSHFPQLHNPLVAGKAIACSVAQQQVCEYVGGGGRGEEWGGGGGGGVGRGRVHVII